MKSPCTESLCVCVCVCVCAQQAINFSWSTFIVWQLALSFRQLYSALYSIKLRVYVACVSQLFRECLDRWMSSRHPQPSVSNTLTPGLPVTVVVCLYRAVFASALPTPIRRASRVQNWAVSNPRAIKI
ncbi:hypothetical protein ElyMa_004941000 [Elysia marginata]|uniref:Secreted protein n=1 Tax=Elysia marginata TaxID=1093978 RepID=A0AAV4J582_9GAST|nr:hypothetical protein ElyMa_004941000 [Elysia marginata]